MPTAKTRQKWIDNGKCASCGKNSPKDGRKSCISCLEDMKVRSKQAKKRYEQTPGLCANCGADTDSYYCSPCKEKRYRRQKKRLKKRVKEGLCIKCPNEALDGHSYCLCCLNKQKEYRRLKKKEVFEAYGGAKCACCGESTFDFLTIDHVNNDGADHRREIGAGGTTTYMWLIRNKFPEGFQVLCANCQLGKAVNGGVCSHQL